MIQTVCSNIYKTTGLLLRMVLPSSWVESIKKIVPNPNGFQSPAIDSKADVFVLSIINWDFRYQRPQHIAKGLSETGQRVFYVEMELSDSGLQISKVSKDLYRVRLSANKTGHIQAYTGQPESDQKAAWIDAFFELCETVQATSFKRIIIQHPFWWQLAQHLSPEFQVVFDCMDDISGFSNTEQFLLDLEQDLIQNCDLLVVSSECLKEKYEHLKDSTQIRNGVELEHFENNEAEKVTPPEFLKLINSDADSNRIQVGYVGAIAEWFDAALVKEVAESNPCIDFHLCGAVSAKEPEELAEISNVHMYGEIPYKEVPRFIKSMDVLTIPFKIVPIIEACDPVKFYEYSSLGKPTVTTPLPELRRASELTFVASTASEFSAQIRNAFDKSKESAFRGQLETYASENTWSHRTRSFNETFSSLPKISIVILAYGDPKLTKETVHSLFDSGPTYPNMEVLVVDNGSSAKNIKEMSACIKKYPNVSLIENGSNFGFAKGNNVGLKAATGEFVMLLNNDTVVAPGSVYAMMRHLVRNPKVGVVGPLTNNIGNEAKLSVEYADMKQMKKIAREVTLGYRGVYSSIDVVAYFAVMFRRADLDIFGLLAEEYKRGMFEDDDHCNAIKSKGYICALAEDAFIHHHLSATFSTLDVGEKQALFERNKKIYEKKWGKWLRHKYREIRPKSTIDS